MLGDKLLDNLDNLIKDKNKLETDEKENNEMAKLNREAVNRKAEENATTTQSETSTVETASQPTAPTTEELDNISSESDKLLNDAMAALNSYNEEAGNSGVEKTENFTGAEGITGVNTELSTEELQAAAKKKADAEARNQRNKQYNDFVDKQFSELRQEAGDDSLSPEQIALQLACRTYGTHEGFLMADGAKPVLRLARAYKTKDKKPVVRTTATQAEISALQTGNKKGYKRGNVQEYDTVLRYNMSGPKTCFGSVISLPVALNEISLIDLQHNNFTVPKAEELKNSPRITVAYDQETFFSVLMLYFGGEIKESDRVKLTKAPITAKSFILKGSLVPSTVSVNGELKSVIKKQIKSRSRSSIYVQENIIPYQVYETVAISAADADTKRAITDAFAKQLTTEERMSPYQFLDAAAKAAIYANLDGTSVSDVTCNLFTGSAVFGQGALKDVNLRHWSDSTLLPSGKYEKNTVQPIVVKHVYVTSKNDATKSSAKAVKKTLGLDLTLAELGVMGYPAAEALAKVNFDEQKIVDLMQAHKADVKQKREARNLALGKTPKVVARKSAEVDAELTTRLYLNALNGRGNADKLGVDVKKVQMTMLQTSLQ